MEKQTVVMALLVLLVLVTAMQSVQLANLQGKLSGYAIESSGLQPQATQPQSAQALPSNIQQLPQQIGGC